ATLHNVLDRVLARGGPPERGREILEAVWAKGRGEVAATGSGGTHGADPLLRGGTYVQGVVHLAAQVADALEYAHGQGVFHLDLKPSNVLLAPSGRPMLLDFNLAKDRECREHFLGGTLPYMAPEQLRATATKASPERQRREELDLDGRADVFALGVLLYELLAGQHPFGPVSLKEPEDQVRALLLARQAEGARPLHEVNARVGK